jgi:proline racemase
MEIPAGLIMLHPTYRGPVLQSVTIQTAPAFVHTSDVEFHLEGGPSLHGSIVFSGVFFILVDAGQLKNFGSPAQTLCPQNVTRFATLGPDVLAAANRSFQVSHPEKPGLKSIDLVMFYLEGEDRSARDIVISGAGGIDRSPCGAGTGAKVAHLFSQGKLAPNQDYVLESFLGTRFTGRIREPARVGSFDGVIPEIEGTAHITGMHQFLLDSEDPLREGFIF